MNTTPKKKLLVLYTTMKKTAALSYTYAYPEAFSRTNTFDVTLCNFGANPIHKWLDRWKINKFNQSFDAVILLHTAGEAMHNYWRHTLSTLDVPIVWFVVNEHRGLPSKMQFAEDVGISMLVTQSFSQEVRKKYQQRLGCNVISLPVMGLNPKDLQLKGPRIKDRQIDIGYRVFPGPPWLGHWEREDIAGAVISAAEGRFKTDISLDPKDRLAKSEWIEFLQHSKTQLCVPAGGEFFELDDRTRLKIEVFLRENPKASRSEISTLFPSEKKRVRLRILNPRMLEATSTYTPQIMYRDTFEGPLEADHDFIALDKDHSNMEEVLDRINDHAFLETIAENCAEKFFDFASYNQIFKQLDRALTDIV